jgi:oxygen-independent coproporphyrinogen-3 oxidase
MELNQQRLCNYVPTLLCKEAFTTMLISKYNVAAPRYTSYPTVPYWDKKPPGPEEWLKSVKYSFHKSNREDGISIYIHLPYCESLCTYCACNTRITVNHAVELPYIEAVLKEWSMYKAAFNEKPVIKEIHLGGGTPTFFSPAHLDMLIKGIISSAEISPQAEFSFEAHPGNTSRQHLLTLYNLGFKRVSFGIQDFDPIVQEVINRKQSFKEVKDCVDLAREIGYTSINFDLIYGLPLQTKRSIIETINLSNQLKPDRIAFYNYAHVPWIKPGQRKFTEADLPSGAIKLDLYETGRKMFIEAGYEEIGMDHFALKSDTLYKASVSGKLHRNFMGYTHNYTQLMIGLGVSSISDTWYGYMQNVKVVEDYLAMVKSGVLPIFKGHLLSKQDIVFRKHILNIMCRFETSWENENLQDVDLESALKRLVELEKDGLVVISPFHLIVTPLGRSYLRNICMAFDNRLWKNVPETEIFSLTM